MHIGSHRPIDEVERRRRRRAQEQPDLLVDEAAFAQNVRDAV